MRHITALTPDKVPRDDEFKFRERAKALVEKWHQILKPNGESGTNGTAKSDGGMDHQEAVTVGTAALNLNGKAIEGESGGAPQPDADCDEHSVALIAGPRVDGQVADEPHAGTELAVGEAGDISAMADVTMSEA
jgi:hypothetical protein